MDPRLAGGLALAALAMLACASAAAPVNPYPGGAGGNGNYGGGGNGSGSGSGSGSSGGYTSGGSSGGGTSTSGSGTSGSTTSGGSSGGASSGGNHLLGPLAFTVASAGQLLPVGAADGGVAPRMGIDMASYFLDCTNGTTPPAGSRLEITLYSGTASVSVAAGTYYVLPSPGSGIPYATAALIQTDGMGNETQAAFGQSGPVIWSPSVSGVPIGTFILSMVAGSGSSVLSGSFVAPFCGTF